MIFPYLFNLNRFINGWGGRIRTLGMPEPESGALPLGDTPLNKKLH